MASKLREEIKEMFLLSAEEESQFPQLVNLKDAAKKLLTLLEGEPNQPELCPEFDALEEAVKEAEEWLIKQLFI